MKLFQTCAAVLVLALAACSPPATRNAATSAVMAPAAHAKGRGEVVVLQPEYSAVTIRHEAILEYGMGAMTMEFTTRDAAQLAGIKVGDRVTFELKGPTEIEEIDVIK